jgi:hypothetical protein
MTCRQLQKQKRDQEQREFEALQEQGLNPYEVYRCGMSVNQSHVLLARAKPKQGATPKPSLAMRKR